METERAAVPGVYITRRTRKDPQECETIEVHAGDNFTGNPLFVLDYNGNCYLSIAGLRWIRSHIQSKCYEVGIHDGAGVHGAGAEAQHNPHKDGAEDLSVSARLSDIQSWGDEKSVERRGEIHDSPETGDDARTSGSDARLQPAPNSSAGNVRDVRGDKRNKR